ncbi:bifunctional AAC/APH [Nocardioides silvaticus]|uniref:Bifunctional AAC/APH n=1 Tax=Nocardioides silvaticus TaxID=2201891 RepID=A0A316TH87_9ACTN|nr:phosphotransferase [Nocardioides silvaticus]PWN03770.1 bifunctional AAC/APH [Nocardioides silvaticus]
MSEPAERQARLLAEELSCTVHLEALGGASRTFRVAGTDHIVTVPLSWPDDREPASELIRRSTLQERIAGRVTVAVPRVVGAVPRSGLVVVRRLDGERMITAHPARQRAVRHQAAVTAGSVLAQLHTWEPAAYEDVAVADDYSPEDWRQEGGELARELHPVLSDGQRSDVRRFLAHPPPPPAATHVLSHNDLGIEHILISTGDDAPAVTGIIDWDDAAICDPAYDFGLLLRDLGPTALDTALAAYATHGAAPIGYVERARFYASCKLLEDLAFGYANERRDYVEKSLAAWPWTFGPARG